MDILRNVGVREPVELEQPKKERKASLPNIRLEDNILFDKEKAISGRLEIRVLPEKEKESSYLSDLTPGMCLESITFRKINNNLLNIGLRRRRSATDKYVTDSSQLNLRFNRNKGRYNTR